MTALILNILVIGLCAFGLWRGWRQGMLRQLPSLLAWCLGVLVAIAAGPSLADVLIQQGIAREYTDGVFVAAYMSAALLYFCVYLVIRAAGAMIAARLAGSRPGGAGACFGAFFGLVKYATALSLLLNLWGGMQQGCPALKIADQGDGGVVEAVMLLGPAITCTPPFADLLLERQLREARKISDNLSDTMNVDITKRPTRPLSNI